MTVTRYEGGMEMLPGDELPKRVSPMIELGTTGVRRTAGYLFEEFLPQLMGRKAVQIYREMKDNDPIVGALLFAIDRLLRQIEWRVEPASTSAQDKQAAEFVEQCMQDMSMTWNDTISEILSIVPFGWSWHELVYKRRVGPWETDPKKRSKFTDGKIGWRKIPIRSQETLLRWVFDETGGIRAMVQLAPPYYKLTTIPIEKSLLFRTNINKGSPEGRSLLRNAYRPWYMKKRLEEIEGIGVERDLAGLPVAKVPSQYLEAQPGTKQAQMIDAFRKMVRSVRRDEQEGIILPMAYDQDTKQPLFDFELLASSGGRQFDTNQIIGRYEQRILMSVLADFILVGHEQTGSYAMHTDKTGLFRASINSIAQAVADVFNRYAIPRLFGVNGERLEELPQIVPGDVDPPDLTQLAGFMGQLASAGMQWFPDPELEKFLRQAARLPKLDPQTEEIKEAEARQADIMRLAQAQMQHMQMEQQTRMGEHQALQAEQATHQGEIASEQAAIDHEYFPGRKAMENDAMQLQNWQAERQLLEPGVDPEQEMQQSDEIHQMTLAEKEQAMRMKEEQHAQSLKQSDEQHKVALKQREDQHKLGLKASSEQSKQRLTAAEQAHKARLEAMKAKAKEKPKPKEKK